jgi:hypothetical protein
VYSSLKLHSEVAEVVWRAAMAFSIIASFSADLAFEIAKTGAHSIIISKYSYFQKKKDTQVLQQMLWMMGALLTWPASKVILNRQAECMDFYKMVIQDFEDLKQQIANDPASKKKVKTGLFCIFLVMWVFMSLSHGGVRCILQGFKDDKLYVLAVPLSIRSFIRETNGAIAKDAQRKAEVSHMVSPVAILTFRSIETDGACDAYIILCVCVVCAAGCQASAAEEFRRAAQVRHCTGHHLRRGREGPDRH